MTFREWLRHLWRRLNVFDARRTERFDRGPGPSGPDTLAHVRDDPP